MDVEDRRIVDGEAVARIAQRAIELWLERVDRHRIFADAHGASRVKRIEQAALDDVARAVGSRHSDLWHLYVRYRSHSRTRGSFRSGEGSDRARRPPVPVIIGLLAHAIQHAREKSQRAGSRVYRGSHPAIAGAKPIKLES